MISRHAGRASLVSLALLALLCVCFAPLAALAEDDSPDIYRLDDRVRPLSQSIEMRVDAEEMSYTGRVSIELQVHEATNSFRFHAQEMELTEIALQRGSESWSLEHEAGEGDLVTVTAPATLSPGEYRLDIEFGQEFDTQARGLYRLVSEGDAYLFTQFEATDARQAFPCWDEPRFKIPYQMTLIVPEDDLAVSNTPIVAETPEDGWRRVEFAQTPPLPSYLLALATGPLEEVVIEGLSVPGRILTPKGKAALAQEAVRSTPPILAALEEYFGRPYPYKKLDLIAVPEFWPGAMENPGLITYRDTLLLLDDEALTIAQRRRLAMVNAHEIAHQWFGNLVTMEWWDDLWLNESFASWLGDKITDQVYPEYGMAVTDVQSALGAMSMDALVNTRAIRQPVGALDNMLQAADGLTYEKGKQVLGMFEEWMGEDLFRQGVVDYINAHEWGNATAGSLWSSLSNTAGVDVGSAMATFLDQPGVPLISATSLGDGRVEFQQERFYHEGVAESDKVDTVWQIPVVFRYHDGQQVRTQKVLLDEASQVVEISSAGEPVWLHPNAEERGYYHWDVDPDMLMDLVRNSSEQLSARERTALVGHLSALLDSGRLDGGSYLQSTGHLAADPRPEVVSASVSALGKVRMAFVTDELKEPFRRYVLHMLEPAAQRYGLEAREGEDEAVSLFRPRLISWLGKYGRNEEVIAYAKQVTAAYLEDPQSVDSAVAGACLQITAMDGDWKLYNQFKQGFEAATVPADRQRFLSTLGWFRDKAMLKASLRYALKDELRPQELFAIPMGVGQAMEHPDMLWGWMTDNYDAIMEKVPPMFAIYMPYFASGCTEQRIEAARLFFAEDGPHYVTGQEKELAKVIEASQNCVGLRAREGEAVAAYLSNVPEM